MTSAYPIDLDTLTERVRAHALELGELPTQNKIMAAFKVGRPKAAAVRSTLAAEGLTAPTTAPGPGASGVPETLEDGAGARRTDATGSADLSATNVPSPQVSGDGNAPVSTTTTALDIPAGTALDIAPASSGTAVDPQTLAAVPATTTAALAAASTVVAAGAQWRRAWPLLLLAAAAFVAIWSGWVGLGGMVGFGPINLLPGIGDGWVINSAITLPIGVEAYAALALRVWLNPGAGTSGRARRFARWSAITALTLGAAGQVAYHLMTAAGVTHAPWPITAFVSCLPVAVLGGGAALIHLTHTPDEGEDR